MRFPFEEMSLAKQERLFYFRPPEAPPGKD